MKAAQKRKQKKMGKAYSSFKNELAVVFQKQFLVDDEGNTYMQEIPLAIGRRVANSTTEPLWPPNEIQKQSKGVAVEIEHYFLDELWNLGSQQIDISDECQKVRIKNADGTRVEVQEDVKEESEEEEKVELQNYEEDKVENTKVEEQDNQEEEKEETKESLLSPEEMDELIKRNFFMCLVRHVKDSDIPMEPSLLQGEYMYKYEHKDLGKIDFKKSNYNKITKFLRKMKQQKYISFTKPKGKDHEIIAGINRKSKVKI